MGWIIDAILFNFGAKIFQKGTEGLKKKGILVYLKTLQVVRKSLLTFVAIFFLLQLMVLGFAGVIVTGAMLSPLELETKLWILFGASGALFLIPLVFLMILLSDKFWFHASGAKNLLNSAE
ncbi:MAG: hypothetical protein V4736_04080 [Bdellovibrionota bacterium]